MKRMSKCIAYVLAFIVSVNMLFAGSIVAEAQEADGTQTEVTGVSVSSVNGGDIYTESKIKITVSYAISNDVSLENVELWFAKENVDIEEEGEGAYLYYDGYKTVGDGVVEVSGYASGELGTQVLKRIVLSTSDGEVYKYDYVSSGDNKGKLQLYDFGTGATVDTYIEGCTYEVVAVPSYATIDSLSLDTGDVQSDEVGKNSTIYLNVGIVNHTDEEITIPASTDTGCRVWYYYTPEGETDYSNVNKYSMKEDLVIPAYGKGTAKIPMKLYLKGEYNVYSIEIEDSKSRLLNYCTDGYEYGGALEAFDNKGNLIQSIDLTTYPIDFTVVESTGGSEEPDQPEEPEPLNGEVTISGGGFIWFVSEGNSVKNPELTAGAEKQDVQVSLLATNNTNKTYTFDVDSYIKWTLTGKNGYIQEFTASYSNMVKLGEKESSTSLKSGEKGSIYFDINVDEDIIPGNAELDSICIYGNAEGVGTKLCTYYEVIPGEKNMSGTFGDPDSEDETTQLPGVWYMNTLVCTVTNPNADAQAPQITSITKKTSNPIYTGTPVEFEVTYEDDKSAVEEIWLYFKGENGRSCVGSSFNTEEEGTEEEVTDILGQSGTATISVYSGSEDRSGIGKYELERIEITDVWGNTRVYSDEYSSGEEVSFDVQPLSEEEEAAILWDSWKKACAFEKVILKNGVRITNAVLKNVSDRNGVKAGAEFAVDVTVQNESDTEYTIGGCQLRWEGPLTDEEYTAETYAYLEKEITVQPGKSAVLTVPVRLEETEPCGERTLRDLYIYDSENTGDNEIYSEIAEDGTIYNYYRNNRTESTKSMDADFGVHNLQTVISKATASRDGSIVKKCTSCGKGVSSVRIPYLQNISLSATDFTYNGKVQTPAVSVVGSDGKVIGASNYSVSYSGGRKNIGHYAVTVSFGGNYSGSVTKTFNINPKGTKLSSVKAAKKKATVKWKKQTKYTKGYQIQYSTSKNFSSGVKTKNVNGNKKTSLTLKGLKSKKTYYVRIRTFQNVSGGKCYSVWSGIKKVKIK